MTDLLLDTLPCGVVSFTDDGTVVFTNDTLRRLLGYDEAEIEGRHVERLLTVAGRIFYQTHVFPLLRLHGRAEEIFLLLRRRDGGEVGALVNAVRRERGGAMVNDCVVIEVRERRRYEDELLAARRAADAANAALSARSQELELANERLEQQAVELELQQHELQEQAAELEVANDELVARSAEVEQARAEAEQANQAKSNFLSTMSHELRTPLNAIGGYVELLAMGLRGPVSEAQAEDLARIRRANQHLMGLVTNILDFARLEAGQVEFHLETVALASVVADVEPLVAPQVAAKGLSFAIGDASTAAGLHVRADAGKLRQVLLNLLANAVKFTDAGGRVALGWDGDARAGVARVRVADTGRGIPAERLATIFDPFVQVDRHHTPASQQGIGLGLAISRDLVRGMAGELTVESDAGRGATFTITLPLADR